MRRITTLAIVASLAFGVLAGSAGADNRVAVDVIPPEPVIGEPGEMTIGSLLITRDGETIVACEFPPDPIFPPDPVRPCARGGAAR